MPDVQSDRHEQNLTCNMTQVEGRDESHMPPEGLAAFMAAHMQPHTSDTTHTAALL